MRYWESKIFQAHGEQRTSVRENKPLGVLLCIWLLWQIFSIKCGIRHQIQMNLKWTLFMAEWNIMYWKLVPAQNLPSFNCTFCSKVSSSHRSSPSSQAGKSPGRAPPPWSPPASRSACSSTTPSPPPPAPPHFGHRPHSHKWSDRAPARFHFTRLIIKVPALQTFK